MDMQVVSTPAHGAQGIPSFDSSRCPEGVRNADDLDVRDAYAAGRAAWPGVELGFEDFRRRVGGLRFDSETDWRKHSADFYLCCACAQRLPAAVRALERLLPRATLAITRVYAEPEFVEEILQRLRYKLLVGAEPKIAMYQARGSLIAWLNSMASHLALDARQSNDAERRKSTLPISPGCEQRDLDDWLTLKQYTASFQQVLSLAVASLPAREREVLELKICRGQNIDRMGTRYGVHRATVARWLRDARQRIARDVRCEIARRHGLSEAEFRGVARDVLGLLALDFSSGLVTGAEQACAAG